ncbi:MAG: hydrogenase maturation nickel metallochaperone HypA [Dehalococcoidia bacterium]|nr:hydrogenase maturation nickel metallochaperone HypA [Dehalococcoidia bacterium]
MGNRWVLQPTWAGKEAEGKMFRRLECDRCGAWFQFGERPRVTRVPRCPVCGSMNSHPRAA